MVANFENKVKLTKRIVEGARSDSEARLSLWDRDISGFHLRIYPTGRKVYYFQYRNSYKATRKIKIGVHGNISTEQARDTAQKLALEVSAGIDPAANALSKKSQPTMSDLCKEYLNLHAHMNKRETSTRNDTSMIDNIIIPAFGRKKLEGISGHDLQKLHKGMQSTPYQANRVRSLLSKMFSLAMEWNWHTENPAKYVSKYQEDKRTRWLDEEEMQRLWKVLDGYYKPAVSIAIKMLLLTGARKTEVLSARWEQFDFKRGVWIKPSHLTKQKREEHLPLSTATLKLLEEWREKNNSEFLFPGKIPGQCIQEIKKSWATIRTTAGLEGVRLHDLRHTHASHLVSSGLSLSIVGKLLGHTQTSTTQRYAHLADEPLRQAAEIFGQKVMNG